MGFARLGTIGLAGFTAFIFFGLIRAPRLHGAGAIIVAIVLSLLVVAAIAWIPLNRWLSNLDAWRPVTATFASILPFLLYLGLSLLLIGLVNLIWYGGSMIAGTGHLAINVLLLTARMRFVRIATVAAVVVALGVTAYGFSEAHHPALTSVDVTSPDLPAQFDGFRIALLADIHVGVGLGRPFVQGIVDQVNQAKPDLIVIAGDLSNGTPAQLGNDLEPLTQLKADAGVLVTTGNHEFDADAQGWIDWLDAHNLPVLDNSGVVLTRGQASIDVLGINDRVGTAPHEADLAAAVQKLHDTFGVPVDGAGRFRILIAHEPLQVYGQDHLASKIGVDLQLSGHTHGGQIWPIGYFVTTEQPVLDGTHVLDGITVVTSRGVGSWGPPERTAAPPEIPIITLHKG